MKVESVFLEITTRCNLKCKGCYNSSWQKEHKDLDFNTVVELIERLIPLGLKHVTLSGGEPILHPEWERYLTLANAYTGVDFMVITNGTVFNTSLAVHFADDENLNLQISLDGSDEETNSYSRGKGSFEKTLKNVAKYTSRTRSGTNKNPVFKMVLTRHNVHDIERYYQLAAKFNARASFTFITRQGQAREEWEILNLSDSEKIKALKLINRFKPGV